MPRDPGTHRRRIGGGDRLGRLRRRVDAAAPVDRAGGMKPRARRGVTQMRSFGIVLNSNVQAERHGPSMTTRSPVARTVSNSRRYWPTSPPGLERMRTSAKAGTRAASKKAIVKVRRRTGIVPLLHNCIA